MVGRWQVSFHITIWEESLQFGSQVTDDEPNLNFIVQTSHVFWVMVDMETAWNPKSLYYSEAAITVIFSFVLWPGYL